ncbi:Transcription factor himD-like protein [Cladobotryum mycophilum]|uniref:Transcription factor himD-like protein n=1 Tax=Cladobotryum mycophilum TaxID=491253 RepID=A0ABR0SGP4_9HYPO
MSDSVGSPDTSERSMDQSRNPLRSQPPDAGHQPEQREIPKTRACANCARLKMKCRWPVTGASIPQDTSCIRCARMKISCRVPEPSQRKKRGKSTRVAQLERKIDDIVSMLAATQQVQVTGTPPLTPESQDVSVSSTAHDQIQRLHRVQHVQTMIARPSEPSFPLSIPGDPSTTFQLIPGFCFTREEVLSYFDIYRKEFMPNYPFVIIPEDIEPSTFHSEARCLFWIILVAVAPQSTAVQQGVTTWFRQYIADRMLVRQEKDLVLLQAILVHLAWGDFHFYVRTEATNLIQLALALVLDLRLDRSPESCQVAPKSLLSEAWATINGTAKPQPHTSDEKRAVLGVYHTTSLVAALFKRGLQMPWSNHLAQCCDSLTGAQQYESDLFLVALVKIQRVAERAYCMMPGLDTMETASTIYRNYLDMVISNVRRELEDLTNSLDDSIKRKKVFWAYYHVLLMRLSEPAISMQPPSLTDPGVLPVEPFQRFETVWNCLLAAVDFFNVLLSIPANELPGLPASVTGLMAFSIVTTSRLLLQEPSVDWQPVVARKRLDFADAMKRLSDRFEDADGWAKEAGRRRRLLDGGGTLFCRFSFKLRWIRQWYLSKISQEPSTLPETERPPSVEPPQDGDLMWQDYYNFDDGFWADFMTMYDPALTALPTDTAQI